MLGDRKDGPNLSKRGKQTIEQQVHKLILLLFFLNVHIYTWKSFVNHCLLLRSWIRKGEWSNVKLLN